MPLSHRKSSAIVLALCMVTGLLFFQNCGGSGGGTSQASSVVPLLLSVQQANCNSAVDSPMMKGIFQPTTFTPAMAITLNSGLGSTSSGDSRPITLEYEVERGIVNEAIFNNPENNCNSHLNIQLLCEVVATNPATPADGPLSATSAFDNVGNNLLPAKAPLDVAKDSFVRNDCQAQMGLGQSRATFKITPATANERCVQSNYWLKLTAQSRISGVNNSQRNSGSTYLKVTINNGCWEESRLKDSAGPLPRVINFGTVVAIDGNWAAVVAPTDDASDTLFDVGSVYMYMFDGSNWVQKQKIILSDAAFGDTIASVAIRGETLVLGSPYRNSRGMAFFYRLGGQTWTRIQQVDSPEAILNQFFGQTVGLSDRYVFVGSPNYSNSLAKNGAVSVYSYTSAGMTFVKTLYGPAAYAAFGSALAVSNSLLAVGAPQSLGKENLAAGSVYVFDEASGAFNLVSSKVGSALSEKFGSSVAIYGSHLAVGSPNFAVNSVNGFGRVSYYDSYTSAAPSKTFQGAILTDNLGHSVALSATGLYIGVPYANNRAGRVDHYLYGGIPAGTLYYCNLAYNETANSAFGFSVATSGNYVVIGARIKSDPNDNAGAAYINKFK